MVEEVARRLRERYGPIPARVEQDPLDLLIRTILSQNTSDRNRDLAYSSLRARFPSWEEVLAAPEEEIAEAIKPAGLHLQRARRIKEVLSRIREERGDLSLAFLAELPTEEAETWLLSLPGVGKKTAYVVLLFAFKRPVFPVDTHIQRIATRLGLIARGDDPHKALAPLIPKGKKLELHLHLIRFGRETCRARNPSCPSCPLLHLCPFGQKTRKKRP